MKTLVTGANGFVGRALCESLIASGQEVFGMVRSAGKIDHLPSGAKPVVLDSWEEIGRLDSQVGPIDTVVHLAARVHQMRETAADPLAAFRQVNTLATTQLAQWAGRRGVRRFIFLSSIKVSGEGQDYGQQLRIYNEQDAAPCDPYGVSKWEAEQSLQSVARETGLETVILRPTLIYGPDVKANFLQLMRLVAWGLPLPLGAVRNARSLLYLGNLVDAIRVCQTHPKAAGQTFLISDGEDLSTPDLIRELARAMGRSPRLFPLPPRWLTGLGQVTGKSAAVQRLLGSLRVDSRCIRESLGWTPPFSPRQGLAATVAWYRDRQAA